MGGKLHPCLRERGDLRYPLGGKKGFGVMILLKIREDLEH